MAECPEIEITVEYISPECENGKRQVKLKATVTGIEGPLEYEWDFGDDSDPQFGSMSGQVGEWNAEITTVHRYETSPEAEDYTVTFRLTNKPDCENESIEIKVDSCLKCPDVQVSVESISDECFDDGRSRDVTLKAVFTDVPARTTAYWSYDDGDDSNSPPIEPDSDNREFTVTHRYEVPGPYTARLNFTAPAGCQPVSLKVGPLEPCVIAADTDTPVVTIPPPEEPERGRRRDEEDGSFSCSFLEILLVATLMAMLLSLFASCVPNVLYATLVTLVVFVISLILWLALCRPSACRVWRRVYWTLTWVIIIGGFIAALFCVYLIPLLGIYAVIRELVGMAINRIQGCEVPSGFSWPFCIRIPTTRR